MSQKAVLVRVEGNLIQEIFHSVPAYEEACQICKDNGWEGTESHSSNYYNVEYEWLDIGEGELGMDSFIDDETLLYLYSNPDYVAVIKTQFGLDVNVVDSGDIEVLFEDL